MNLFAAPASNLCRTHLPAMDDIPFKWSEDSFDDFLTVESHIRTERYTAFRQTTGEYAPRVSPAPVTLGRKLYEHFSKPGVTTTSGFFRGFQWVDS